MACVAPLAGAWIEISGRFTFLKRSLVAPLAGAWIEIVFLFGVLAALARRSPRGSVD